MRAKFDAVLAGCLAVFLASAPATAQDAVEYRPDGTTLIVDLPVPVPSSISTEAAAMLKRRSVAPKGPEALVVSIARMRAAQASWQAKSETEMLKAYSATVERRTMGGVVVRIITPAKLAPGTDRKLLINVHGGAFVFGKGSINEAVPIAALSGLRVIAIDYRLAPENPFPAAVDDTIAVYRELLKTYKPQHMALYGSSAGAVLTAEAAVRMRQLGLPTPAALGFFSGTADWSRPGDTEAIFGVSGFERKISPVIAQAVGYTKGADLRDPVLSPIYADLTGFPPTLCMTGTRDLFLSGTSNFHRALLRAGVDAKLVVFDAMPHVHWGETSLPEATEALEIQANFLAQRVK